MVPQCLLTMYIPVACGFSWQEFAVSGGKGETNHV